MENGSGSSDPVLSDRLQRLNAALDKARPKDQSQPAGSRADTSTASGMAMAFRLGTEFVSGVLVGALVGWGLDKVLGIAPWGIIILTLVGFGAGVLNMMRAAGQMPTGKGPKA
ncbi:ATP synthase protein I [Azorhizobium oxalatiphilum]|uniref:ATP synthase protein I n=1 Tax=Azorhizobium oxalatiphilum TaxID=980631 RepID=A0A917F5H7_9HYPH|nr:AtpZ/AtpI family protein [Azorhizobium oxalatiphilum]GGF45418.1 ATP synthase protein I [Azorhizobium oxalatiphilum]